MYKFHLTHYCSVTFIAFQATISLFLLFLRSRIVCLILSTVIMRLIVETETNQLYCCWNVGIEMRLER